MTAAFEVPKVNGALPAVRCGVCGTLANHMKPHAPCVLGCDDRDDERIQYDPAVGEVVDVELPDDTDTPCCPTPQAAAASLCRCWGSGTAGRWATT